MLNSDMARIRERSFFPERAVTQIATMRMKAKLQRSLERFRSPRRLAVSILAAVLALIWIGQAIAGIMLRESANPEQLAVWIPLSLTGYAIWNVLKITFQAVVEPFEWTEPERELLIGAPIRRADLIWYRFHTISIAALFKSTIFTLVMIPDLSILPLGFIGMFGGLLFIDLIRMSLEIFMYGLSPSERLAVRCAVASLALTAVGLSIRWALQNSDMGMSLSSAASLGFLIQFGHGLVAQSNTWMGKLLMAPFHMFADIVLAQQFSVTVFLKIVLSATVIWGFFRGLVKLDDRWMKRRRVREAARFGQIKLTQSTTTTNAKIEKLILPFRLGGVGSLAWRQLLGAHKYRVGLTAALSIPFMLGCLPAFSGCTGTAMVMNVVGGLAFYSFLLLPAAFKFDFRRDVKRMAVFKSLPISPLKIISGQIATPILLTSLFQFAVLFTTMLISPYHPALLVISLAVLLPFNIFIFSFENLLFVWFPHRLQEEGIHVFLRTILSFTAKGLLFVVALAAAISWVFVAKSIAGHWTPDALRTGTTIVFITGLWLSMGTATSIVMALLTRAFRLLDPSCDLAGVN